MKIKLTQEETLRIVEDHLIAKGFKTGKTAIVHKEKTEYEYHGNPTNEDRREIKVKYFDGIEAEVELNTLI
ncbi:hypothetical protein [Paenibacillus sp. FSL H3-0333]|uniref:hypothetical protein n=1 Tax=Paenibacillus sp. FSL H3-0333 TaxID=2921373 RepID=UPI0030FADE76